MLIQSIVLQPFDADMILAFLILIVLLISSALFSGSEVAFFSFRPSELKSISASQLRTEKQIMHLLASPKRLLATILISNNLVNVAIVILSAFITNQIFDFSGNPTLGFIIQVCVITFVLVLVGEILPKIYATENNLKLAKFMAFPLTGVDLVLSPLSRLMVASTTVIDKKLVKKGYEVTMDELTHAIDISSDTSTPPEEKKILKGIVKFGDIDVKQIMTPRMDVVAFDEKTLYSELLTNILKHGNSRIPIYRENLDKVIGIIYIKDLINHLDEDDSFEWQKLIRPPMFVPESKKINTLLKEFQEKKIHLALVVDEYGGASGLVTLEDILEEIIGEINDELDEVELVYSKLDDDNYIFEGKTLINDVCRIMNINRQVFDKVEGESDTLAGLLLELFGKIPGRNETAVHEDLTFTVESVDKRKIKRIKVSRVSPDENNKPSSTGQGFDIILIPLISLLLFGGCQSDYTPKPRGFFRIQLPEKQYQIFSEPGCPFEFEYPAYSVISVDSTRDAESCWFNIIFPSFNGQVHFTYKTVSGNINQFLEDSRSMAYRHTIKAEAIRETVYSYEPERVFGILYELEGNTASALQFHVTDSVHHFLRGSLYFNVLPHSDSIAPVVQFVKEDIRHIVNTMRWK
jgi:putative hemolysin